MITLTEKLKIVQVLGPILVLADADYGDVSLQDGKDYFQSVLISVDAGLWIDGDYTFTLEEADDDGAGSPDTYTDVAVADMGVALPVIDGLTLDNQVHSVEYLGTKEWVRVSVVVANETLGLIFGVFAVLGNPTNLPIT